MNIIHIGMERTGNSTLQNNLYSKINRRVIANEIFSLKGEKCAKALYLLYRPAKILITIRSQPGFVIAQYLKYLEMLNEPAISFPLWLKLYPQTLDYRPLLKLYGITFGYENLFVLPSEQMHWAGSPYQIRLAELLDIPLATVISALKQPADQRISRRLLIAHKIQDAFCLGNAAILSRRILPPLVYSIIRNWVVRGRRVEMPELSEEWKQRIAEASAPGNRWIAEKFNLPLAQLGYPI